MRDTHHHNGVNRLLIPRYGQRQTRESNSSSQHCGHSSERPLRMRYGVSSTMSRGTTPSFRSRNSFDFESLIILKRAATVFGSSNRSEYLNASSWPKDSESNAPRSRAKHRHDSLSGSSSNLDSHRQVYSGSARSANIGLRYPG